MSATALLRDPLLPRQPGGMAGGAALAIGVHAVLVVALAAAVNWRTQVIDVVASAELWAALPQTAAPPVATSPAPQQPAPPPPAPVAAAPAPAPAPAPAAAPPQAPRAKPDIALERDRDRAKDKERAAREERDAAVVRAKAADAAKNNAADAAKAATAAEAAQVAAQRADNLRRMIGQAGGASASAPTSTGSAARDAAPSTAYIGRLVAAIRANIVFAGSPPGNPTAEVEVRAGPSGTILSRRLIKPSGVAEWDDAVLRAIDRTAALPRDSDGRVPAVLLVAFRLRE